jgi:archaellum component FlaC
LTELVRRIIEAGSLVHTLVGGLVVIYIAAKCRIILPVRRAAKIVDEATEMLRKEVEGPDRRALIHSAIKTATTLTAHSLVPEWLRPQPRLANALGLFEKAWRNQVVFELTAGEVSTADPAQFLGPSSILPAGFSRGFMRAVPGILTTGGILGTFVGLALGLMSLSDKIEQARQPTDETISIGGAVLEGTTNAGGAYHQPFASQSGSVNPDVLVDGILGMMGGMATAFWTSITGIALALAWIRQDRKYSRRLEMSCAALQDVVCRILPVIGTTELAMHRLRLANEQTESLKTLSFDIGTRVSEGIDQSIQEHLVPQIAAMKDVVDKVANLTGESQVEGMERMVQQFSNVLGERLSGQFDNLSATIKEICSWQEQIKEQVDGVLTRVGEIVVAQDRMLNSAARSAELFQGSLGNLATIHEHIDSVAVSLEEVNRATAELQENTLESTRQMTGAASAIGATMTTVTSTVTDLRETLTAELSELSSLGEALSRNLETIQSSLATTMEKFSDDCEAGVRQTFAQFDEHLGAVSRTLSGTVSETNQQSLEIGSAVAGLRQTVEELDQTLMRALPVVTNLATLVAPQEAADSDESQDAADAGDTDESRDSPSAEDDGRVDS